MQKNNLNTPRNRLLNLSAFLFIRKFILSVLIVATNTLSAQYYLEPAVRIGRVIPNSSNVGRLSKVSMYSAELRLGKQTTGKYAWEELFNYPELGVALRYGHFTDRKLGDKIALFGYLNGTIYRSHRWTFHYQFGLGLACWSNPYDSIRNPDNRFIGSYMNAHIDLALGVDCRLAPQTALTLRANFSHSSNAAFKLPNMGINPLSGVIGLKCYLQKPDSLIFRRGIRDFSFRKSNSFYVMTSVGTRQSKKDAREHNGAAGPYYLGLHLQIGYLRQFHPKFRYGGGLDINYSSELARHLPESVRARHGKYISQAAFVAFEVLYGRIVLHVSGAVYINRAFKFNTPFYERAGLRILLGKKNDHFVGLSVKANAGSVDFLELHYGYRFIEFGKGWKK